MSNCRFSFSKEKLDGTNEFRYLEVRSRWYLSREACIKKFGVDPEDYLVRMPEDCV